MLASILTSVSGFVFWILAAKLYSPEEVGLGTALISAISLICLFSYLGFDQSIIRFFPNGNKNKIFSTSLTIVTIFTIIFGIIFLLCIDVLAPKLNIIKNYSLIFIVFLIATSLASLSGISFIALRKAEYYLIQNIFMSSRIVILLLFVIFGAIGILYSVGLSIIIALMISAVFLIKYGIKPCKLDKNFLRDSLHFSLGNYIIGLLGVAPTYILPIMVLTVLGAQNTAYYYISFTIASILFVISSSFSTSLFVEGSHGESLKKNAFKSLFSIFILLTIAIAFFYVFGKYLLSFIGHGYTNGFNLLIITSFSSYFVAIYQIYLSIKKVHKNIKELILLNVILFILLIGLSYILTLKFGIVGIGYAWVVGYGLISLLIVIRTKFTFLKSCIGFN